MSLQQNPAWIWTRYWQGGQQEGCLAEALSLSDIWRTYFSAFPAGTRLLDLAAGAGEVALLAAGTAQDLGRRFEIDAVDAAHVPPALVAGLRGRGVRLRGDTYLRSLPFEDASYDGVFSQFGIEYGERPAAFREAARLLSANGQGLFVMHHRESAVTRACTRRLNLQRAVVGNTQCFAAAERVFTCHLQRAPMPAVMHAEARFRDEVAMLRRRLGVPPVDPNLVEVVSFLSDISVMPGRYDPADALRRLRFAQEEIEAWRLRQQAQQEASLEPAQVDAIVDWLVGEGLDVQPPEVVRDDGGEIVAWALRVSRPAASSTPSP